VCLYSRFVTGDRLLGNCGLFQEVTQFVRCGSFAQTTWRHCCHWVHMLNVSQY